MSTRRLGYLRSELERPDGLVICSGPSQSGLSTTLYAFVGEHDPYQHNICVFEEESLLDFEAVKQHRFDTVDSERNFPQQLRSLMTQEPDVVMVDALQDTETAENRFEPLHRRSSHLRWFASRRCL